jgi:ketosteroid isomerase-like protein
MKTLSLAILLVVPLVLAVPDAKDDLIQLDKDWGAANLKADRAALEKIYASDLLAVGPDGMGGKSQMLEGLEPAADTKYVTSDYKVMMLGSDTAVMAHNAGSGDASYRSLHVFAKRDGRWQVVATATVPQSSN